MLAVLALEAAAVPIAPALLKCSDLEKHIASTSNEYYRGVLIDPCIFKLNLQLEEITVYLDRALKRECACCCECEGLSYSIMHFWSQTTTGTYLLKTLCRCTICQWTIQLALPSTSSHSSYLDVASNPATVTLIRV
ncbi:hypothetical protein IAQ61_000265 [Plenodomus lingam]|uniref:uncharacterized protein n=1 Tax=Leptosphaeria maculans TaxID=5022 RepID=UPI00332E0344|nr:hypothetical protein IAQ61_000265 [Plenodomus lingam]